MPSRKLQTRALLVSAFVGAGFAVMLNQQQSDEVQARAQARATQGSRPVPRATNPLRVSSTRRAVQLPEAERTWFDDQFLVRPAPGVELDTLAAAYGAQVLRHPGASGYGVLQVPDAGAALSDRLARDPRVQDLSQHARIVGAHDSTQNVTSYEWHLAQADATQTPPATVANFVVAVLDSGVAYENYDGYVQAPSLAGTRFVSPWDFVNDDAHPNDDHQHGTHIASIIGSSGNVRGIVPGVGIMPLKVLDEYNQGYEADLVDAIYWAVDNGADVVNMSLSFGQGYLPSKALLDALTYADEMGVVMVAAAGNAALTLVSWPARSPLVIAVGAGCLKADGKLGAAPYGNRNPAVDLVAPGGCLDRDVNGDNYLDSVLAESIDPDDPRFTGMWLMSGTSQAAAIASGGAIWLLARGVDPRMVRRHLQKETGSDFGHYPFLGGYGAGRMRIFEAVDEAREYSGSNTPVLYHVAMLPYLARISDTQVAPAAVLSVLDSAGNPVNDVIPVGSFEGSSSAWFSCVTTSLLPGTCTVYGPPVDLHGAGGAVAPLAWSVEVAGIVKGGLSYRVGSLFFASDQLDATVAWMQTDPDAVDGLPALWWPGGPVADLGETAEAFAVTNTGTGIATSPFGVILTPPVLPDGTLIDDVTIDGSGISTSPFGIRIVTLDGTGLATSPFGIKLVAFDGSGISTSPFGIKDTFSLLDGGTIIDGTFSDDPVFLATSTIGTSGEDFSATALGELVEAGGWVDASGQPAGSLVLGSCEMSASAASRGSAGQSLGAMEF